MGDYPDDWEGYKFEHAPLIWCLGYSGEKCRDLLQAPIIGRKTDNGWQGGLIPSELIVDTEPMAGTPNAVRSAYIRHKSGDLAKIQFWSYSQGQHALMGDSVDWFHIDEEPKDPTIYPQVLTRTATGDKGRGGRGILTFTPENGRTDLVISFMDSPSSAQTCMNVGWDDAPHLSEKVKTELLASFPPHQRDMRTPEGAAQALGQYYNSQQFNDYSNQARYQNLAAAEAMGGLGSTATSNSLASIAPALGESWLNGQMNNYNNLANIGLGALQGQANAGQTFANNAGQLAQQNAALAAANANRPSGLQNAIGGGASGAMLGGSIAGMLGASTPWGAGIGAGVGILGSLF